MLLAGTGVLSATGGSGADGTSTPGAVDSNSLSTYVSPNIGITDPPNPALDVDRDCGFSVPTADMTSTGPESLWVFCDTALFTPYRSHQAATGTPCAVAATATCAIYDFIPSGTASLTSGSPVPGATPALNLDEAAEPGTETPYRFLPQVNATQPQAAICPSWTQGLVDLPPAGQSDGTSDTVLDTFQTSCPVPSGDTGANYSGIAILNIGGGPPETIGSPSAAVTVNNPSGSWPSWSGSNVIAQTGLFPPVTSLPYTAGTSCSSGAGNQPGGLAFSPVVYNGYLYLYDLVTDDSSCSSIGVARVNLVDQNPANPGHGPNYLNPADYEFLTAQGWQSQTGTGIPATTLLHETTNVLASAPDATSGAIQGGNLSVRSMNGEFVMMYQQAEQFNSGSAVIRTAPTPFGPWSSALTVTPPNVTTPAGSTDPGLSINCANVGSQLPGALGCRAFNLHPELDTSGSQAALVYSYYQSGAQGDSFASVCTLGCSTAAYPTVPGQVELASVPLNSLPAAPVVSAAAPVVDSVIPSSGSTAGGDSVTIHGSGLSDVTGVDVGSVPATVTGSGSGTLTIVTPASAGPQTTDITVITPSGASALGIGDRFTYTVPAVGPNPGITRAGAFFSTRISG